MLRLRALIVSSLVACGSAPPSAPRAPREEPVVMAHREESEPPAVEAASDEPSPVDAEADRILLLGETTTIPGLNSPKYRQYAVQPAGIVEVLLSPDNSNAVVVARNIGAACVLAIDREGQVEIRGYRVVEYKHHRRTDEVVAEARQELAAAGKLHEGRRHCRCVASPAGCSPGSAP